MDERVKRLVVENAESIKLRFILGLLANDDGIVPMEKQELAALLGVSVSTLRKRLKQAGIGEDSVGRIVSPKLSDSMVQNLAPFLYNQYVSNDINDREYITSEQDSAPDWRDVVEYYRRRCEERYGVKPRVDYRKAKNVVNAFIRRYGQDVYAILDAVFENYDTVWRTEKYTIPPVGAVFGWIGEQAARYAVKRRNDTKTNNARNNDISAWL